MLVEATVKLDEQVKRIGRAVDDSKPYWEARKVAKQVHDTHTLTFTERQRQRGQVYLRISNEKFKELSLYLLKGSAVT